MRVVSKYLCAFACSPWNQRARPRRFASKATQQSHNNSSEAHYTDTHISSSTAPSSSSSPSSPPPPPPPVHLHFSQDFGQHRPKFDYFFDGYRLVKQRSAIAARQDSDLILRSFFPGRIEQTLARPFSKFLGDYFLPSNYPQGIAPAYARYTKWSICAAVVSTASNTLSMQALLLTVGVGKELAFPGGAAMVWVMKDGIGQFLGMLVAGRMSGAFDSAIKRWRMMATVLNDVSVFVELLIPILPGPFLLWASAANFGKNISWISMSATRAGINATFVNKEKLGDLTAKCGSQTIFSSFIGTGLGVILNYLGGHDPANALIIFSGLCATHILCVHRALSRLPMPTLNYERFDHVSESFIGSGRTDRPESVLAKERLVLPYRRAAFAIDYEPTVEAVVAAHTDSFGPASPTASAAAFPALFDRLGRDGFVFALSRSPPAPWRAKAAQWKFTPQWMRGPLAQWRGPASRWKLFILFHEKADERAAIKAFLACTLVRLRLAAHGPALARDRSQQAVQSCLDEAIDKSETMVDDFISGLKSSGWNLDSLFIEKQKRVRIHTTTNSANATWPAAAESGSELTLANLFPDLPDQQGTGVTARQGKEKQKNIKTKTSE